jgi:NAD(P)-dependent dehydrogenase (short-subunit alcohol dehydrogenase family)
MDVYFNKKKRNDDNLKEDVKKVALITGSTHGIGMAITLELAKIGYSVVINGASTNSLPKNYINSLRDIYQQDWERNHIFVQADISKRADREIIIKAIKEKYNRIDTLINNAGVPPVERKDLLEASEESFERVIKTNLQGPYFLTQTIANWMISLKNSWKEGYNPCIINISSISSFASSPNRGEYCVSKAGMSMMTKLYADRLAEYGISVYEIQPGIIKTSMTEPVKEKYDKLIREGLLPIKRWGLPIDVAKAVISIVRGSLPYSTGNVIYVDGGFHLRRL